jgi:beta-N-acetylhexosaminidase
MKRLFSVLILISWLLTLAAPVLAGPPAQKGASATATPVPADTSDIRAMMSKMSVADKVGQLFVVTFIGNDLGDDSDIATLVRDYRVGGVVLMPENDNFRSGDTSSSAAPAAPLTAPDQIVRLTNRLQALAASPARPVTLTQVISGTAPSTRPFNAPRTRTPTPGLRAPIATRTPTPIPTATASPTPASNAEHLPLLIGLDWAGDGSLAFSGANDFTPLPSQMAIGATWLPDLSEKTGQVLGQEIEAIGVNLLLGPSLDVLDTPRPGSRGDLRTRTFGGDPFWVGQMGRAFIRGVQEGSGGGVMTAAKHFPGQGAADRRPEDEVATVQKSLQQLLQIEISPFAAVTTGGDLSAPGVTGALMTSHIRYRGFQGNIRQLTPPISLAPQLGDLMALKEFADWRAGGGILLSDALGVPAVRRYYDPQLQKFPYRQVAQDAFLAGNDLLYLSRFALTDKWPDQFQAIRETVLFFRSKYQSDGEFRARVDASVERILKMKQRIYKGNWTDSGVLHDPALAKSRVGSGDAVTYAVARAAATLIYPGREELADRLPSAPLADENILIFTDARETRDCSTCPSEPLISVSALQDVMLRLYGPSATGQVAPDQVRSLSFTDLERLMASPPGTERDIESAIASAQWLVFAHLDNNPDDYPASAALHTFLAKRSDSLRDKRLVVIAFDAPYYLDTTEVSKLTAYFGLYAWSTPFLETAVRALFREFSPVGAPPVSVSGINYDLISALEPAPGQVIGLGPAGSPGLTSPASIQVGSKLQLQTGTIFDRNGHPVPDGTPVEFHLRYPVEGLQLAPLVETTTGGAARTTISLDRVGELWITVQSGEAKESARIVLKIGGDSPGSIATVLPSPTPLPTDTPTNVPTNTPTIEARVAAVSTPEAPAPPPPHPRVDLLTFLFGLLGALFACAAAFLLQVRRLNGRGRDIPAPAIAAVLWAAITGWLAYLLYSFGFLPGATDLQATGHIWAAGLVTLAGGLISLLWSGTGAEDAVRRWLS